jgi:flagellar basal-body rod modification protein FlgD
MSATNTLSNNAVLPGVTAAQGSQQVSTGLATLTNNFQSFLKLLTTQLQNQDPTSPVDPNQFTQQLVEMSGVQAQLLTNNLLTTLVSQGQGGMASGVGYIGKEVAATSASQMLSGGKATWTYQLGSNAASATGTITDALGNTVWSGPLSGLSAGSNSFTWNGQNSSGTQLPDGGTYKLAINAVDSSNVAVNSNVVITGIATAVQMVGGQPYLSVGSTLVPLSSVVGVSTAPAASPASANTAANSLQSAVSSALQGITTP